MIVIEAGRFKFWVLGLLVTVFQQQEGCISFRHSLNLSFTKDFFKILSMYIEPKYYLLKL